MAEKKDDTVGCGVLILIACILIGGTLFGIVRTYLVDLPLIGSYYAGLQLRGQWEGGTSVLLFSDEDSFAFKWRSLFGQEVTKGEYSVERVDGAQRLSLTGVDADGFKQGFSLGMKFAGEDSLWVTSGHKDGDGRWFIRTFD